MADTVAPGTAASRRRRPGVLGVIVVGFAAAPAFRWARRGVHRLVQRHDDPVAVLGTITRTVHADPLRAVATGLRRGLGLSYVALEVHCGPVVEAGPRPGGMQRVERVPLSYRGRELGALRTVPGSPRARRLLATLAEQIAVLVHAALATDELATSRRRIVAAREAERHALRRDLHDGLGPALAGLALEVRAARRCPELLADVERDLAGCGAALRAVVDGLRPPDLAGGLLRAVTTEAGRLSHPDLTIHVTAPRTLPRVAPAVELAAYRIIGEALTNTVRHSGATTCVVRLAAGRVLTLDISDDGCWPVPPHEKGPGLGLGFMRERAAEVGGSLSVRPGEPCGTVVRALLPWDGV